MSDSKTYLGIPIGQYKLLSGNMTVMDILVTLENEDKLNVSDIARITEKPYSTISESLSSMVEVGLLEVEQKGRMRFYKLKDGSVFQLIKQNDELSQFYEPRKLKLKRTKEYVENRFEEKLELKLTEKYDFTKNAIYQGYFHEKKMRYILQHNDHKIGVRIISNIVRNSSEAYNEIGQIMEWLNIASKLDLIISVHLLHSDLLDTGETNLSSWKLNNALSNIYKNQGGLVIVVEDTLHDELDQDVFVEYLYKKIDEIISKHDFSFFK